MTGKLVVSFQSAAGVAVTTLLMLAPQVTAVRLPFGISVEVPEGWRTNDPWLSAQLSAGVKSIDASHLEPRETGHLIIFASPLSLPGEASLEISVMPSRTSQEYVRAMTPAAVRDADLTFRSEIERVIGQEGLRLVAWEGTTREEFGGRLALVRRYRFGYPGKDDMSMESYGIYLGSQSIQIRLQYPVSMVPGLQTDVNAMRNSVRVAVVSL